MQNLRQNNTVVPLSLPPCDTTMSNPSFCTCSILHMCGTADPKSQDQGREVIFSLLLKEFVVSVVDTILVDGVNTVVSTVVVSASVR